VHGFDGGVVDLYLDLAAVDDEEHAGGSALFEDVFAGGGLVAFHCVGELLALLLAQFEQQEVFADGFLDKLYVCGCFGAGEGFDVLKYLFCGVACVYALMCDLASVVGFGP
jgi:hypothetical protein